MNEKIKTSPFNTQKSIEKAGSRKKRSQKWILNTEGKSFAWSNRIERVGVIRNGIPYSSIEIISKKLNCPVKTILSIIGIPQTTYNKKKSEHALLASRDSELIVLINELVVFGTDVFNKETTKFQAWMKKPNISLGNKTPLDYLDTISGINEVISCLNRIEYGNFA